MMTTIRRFLEMAFESPGTFLTDEDRRDLAAIDGAVADWDDRLHRTDALERRVGALEDRLKMPHLDPETRTGC
jgi:hypothetical protein